MDEIILNGTSKLNFVLKANSEIFISFDYEQVKLIHYGENED